MQMDILSIPFQGLHLRKKMAFRGEAVKYPNLSGWSLLESLALQRIRVLDLSTQSSQNRRPTCHLINAMSASLISHDKISDYKEILAMISSAGHNWDLTESSSKFEYSAILPISPDILAALENSHFEPIRRLTRCAYK
jgi:hypothetical protein